MTKQDDNSCAPDCKRLPTGGTLHSTTCPRRIGSGARDPVTASKDGYRAEIEQAVREDHERVSAYVPPEPEPIVSFEPNATDGEQWTVLERMVWTSAYGAAFVAYSPPLARVGYDRTGQAVRRAHEAVRQLRKLGPA